MDSFVPFEVMVPTERLRAFVALEGPFLLRCFPADRVRVLPYIELEVVTCGGLCGRIGIGWVRHPIEGRIRAARRERDPNGRCEMSRRIMAAGGGMRMRMMRIGPHCAVG